MKCGGEASSENCGGKTTNAVYITERGMNTETEAYDKHTRKIYYDDQYLSGLPLQLFSEYPQLKSVIGKRLVLHATDVVNIPSEDSACSKNCYRQCGSISHPEGLDYRGKDMKLRFFFLNLRDLKNYVGLDAKRVNVYAQTVLIEDSLSFPFSLLIRTRQLIINRDPASMIRVGSWSPLLDLNYTRVKNEGPPSDAVFQKQSFMCARMLLDTRERNASNTAWQILYDLGRDADFDNVELTSWSRSVRMYNSFLSGIDREDLHYVPSYSKKHFRDVLELYADKLKVYKTDFDRLQASVLSQSEYVGNVEEMLNIHKSADLLEAKSSFTYSLTDCQRSSATYNRLKKQYDKDRIDVETAGREFQNSFGSKKKSVEKRAIGIIVKVVFKLIGLIAKAIRGIKQAAEAAQIQRELQAALKLQLTMLTDSLSSLSESVNVMELFSKHADIVLVNLADPNSKYDYTSFMSDIEMTSAMQVDIVRWKNLKNDVMAVMSNPEIKSSPKSTEYMRTVSDLCNSGEALTRSAVERAELLRNTIQKKYTLDNKLQQDARYNDYLAKLKSGVISRQVMTMYMAEQQYDVRLDLNNVLFSFCQAYFYENLEPCKDEYKPSFGGSLSELLNRINRARMDSLAIPRPPSTVVKMVRIQDTNTNSSCFDSLDCPIQSFQTNKYLDFKLLNSHPAFKYLDRYKVSEIELVFVGAKPDVDTDILKVRIESSGSFQVQDRDRVYDFITKPLSLAYEYSLTDGRVSIKADVYEPFRDSVQHITPFTTWIFSLSEQSSGIDFSDLTQIVMYFHGSAVDNERSRLARMLRGREDEEEYDMYYDDEE